MVNILYRGENGLIDVATLQMRNKSGFGGTNIRSKTGALWTAGGMSKDVAVLQLATTLKIKDSGKLYYGFNAPTPVITFPLITQDGIVFKFITNENGILRLDPNASNNIVYSGSSMTNGEHLDVENSSSIFLISEGTSWLAFRETGTFTEETP